VKTKPVRSACLLAATALVAAVCALFVGTPPASGGTWPGTNGKIIFKLGHGQNQATDDSLWVVNPDGSGVLKLTDGGTNNTCSAGDEEPQWSPDGTRIVFTRTVGSAQEIWVMNADGTGQTKLTSGASACDSATSGTFSENPSWTRDGTKIIFTRDTSVDFENEDLWIMDANGGNQVKLFGDVNNDESEAFVSPDGSKIVYQVEPLNTDQNCNEPAQSDLFLIGFDGTAVTGVAEALTSQDTDCVFSENASWSPDSTKVAFTRSIDGQGGGDRVFVVAVATGTETALTSSDFHSEQPSFSPDGTKIVFASDRNLEGDSDNVDRLFIMDANGDNETVMNFDQTPQSGQPEWGRVPTAPTPPTPAPPAEAPAAEAVAVTPRLTG
jgi:Tol biopolymer transport system component